MGTSFRVELEELEQARATLQGLLQDVFNDASSALHPVTFQNKTASSLGQGHYNSFVYKEANYDGGMQSSNFGPMDQGVPAITTLNDAHGAAHAAVVSLLDSINQQITDLNDRATKTHQIYAQTEDELHVSVLSVQKSI
ncbi:hypothetical protein KDL01_26660 [Actinospica durhamensis]|uniref:Uncharacterized protein n=1 Tax=Actinospica durhamensis TaxID=1508375 RepID=A0A941ETF2_9ACTN|nr:hypothetical protein [Actinospica durhamensis]MBR7836888.1 hypothetical protein [Actinospica durhamensis]